MAPGPDRPPAVWVHWYLNDASPAIRLLFHALLELVSGDPEKVQRIKELEKEKVWWSILAKIQRPIANSTNGDFASGRAINLIPPRRTNTRGKV
jgi:hypothetical protein